MASHLSTALAGPLAELERRILDASATIEHWFRMQWRDHAAPIYGSVDLRNSGFKLAPVDTNLFPGGFNNLNPQFMPLCVQAAMAAIEKVCPNVRDLLLIPENHTRNLHYLENVAYLRTILMQAGVNVRLGSLLPDITEPIEIAVPNHAPLRLEPLVRRGNHLGVTDFNPCIILLNNDLSAGIPDILRGLDEQFLVPPLHAGWAVRRKSVHFAAYDRVAEQFGALIGIDPWLVNPLFNRCGEVNFHERSGEECLVANVEMLLERITAKYREYHIDDTPYVVVKADAGTYGMGVMTARSPDDVRALNRKQRNKMAVGKEGLQIHEVLIQEGVATSETVNDGVAEPVVYMIDRYVVGGFYRVHTGRSREENLNAPGMHFEPLAFDDCCTQPDHFARADATPNRFYAYGVVARLALLAASIELEETAPHA